MTDMELNNILSDAFPLTDTPDSLSENTIRAKIEKITPVKRIDFPIKKAIAVAALFLFVLGIGFVARNTFFSNDFYKNGSPDSVSYDVTEDAPAPASAPASAEPVVPATGTDNYGTSVENEVFQEGMSEGKASDSFSSNSVQASEEKYPAISIKLNEEHTCTMPYLFGNTAQICYYDENHELIQQTPCVNAVVNDDQMILLGQHAGVTLVEVSDASRTYIIKVTVLEG